MTTQEAIVEICKLMTQVETYARVEVLKEIADRLINKLPDEGFEFDLGLDNADKD